MGWAVVSSVVNHPSYITPLRRPTLSYTLLPLPSNIFGCVNASLSFQRLQRFENFNSKFPLTELNPFATYLQGDRGKIVVNVSYKGKATGSTPAVYGHVYIFDASKLVEHSEQ